MIGDPRVRAELHRADVVVSAVGSMARGRHRCHLFDARDCGIETRLATPRGPTDYLAAQPVLSVALRGRPSALPPRLTVRTSDLAVPALRASRPSLPVVGWLPFGASGRRRTDMCRRLSPHGRGRVTLGRLDVGVPLLDVPAVAGAHVRAAMAIPTACTGGGTDMPWSGKAMAELIRPLLTRRGNSTSSTPDTSDSERVRHVG